jgi:arsenite-transporting ATPase
MDLVLYGGKGGVGKTTCAAATGLALAAAGETLVVSTDPAHSLSDAYETAVGADPTEIADGLWGAEVDPETGVERYERLFEAVTEELDTAGMDVADDDLAGLFGTGAFPGADELAALDAMATHLDGGWDHLVLDTAPTGHTLRLLEMPETVSTGVETALSLRDQLRRKTDAAKTMFFGPMAASGRAEETPFREVVADMERVSEALRDEGRTAFRVVTLPERMVLAETDRLVARLRAAGVPLGPLVVNRVLTEVDERCARCTARRERQQAALDGVDDRYDLPVVELPDLTGREEGRAALERLAPALG